MVVWAPPPEAFCFILFFLFEENAVLAVDWLKYPERSVATRVERCMTKI